MSKNIIIQEGGTSYQFTAKKLKTDKVGGGSVLWVPEEDTVLTKKKITEEGTYKASDEGYYGYSEVEVDVTGATSTKRIAQNGTYKAEDDGLIGYSKVKVNVRGGNGSADSSGKPRTTFDTDGNVEYAPGGIGSSVVGIDPTTGEWVTVGVDSGGNLVTTPIPASIDIINPPTKTSYNDDETIDYAGIVVGLKTKSGSTFTNATYPNGHITMQELIFSVSTADASSGHTETHGKPSGSNIDYPIETVIKYDNQGSWSYDVQYTDASGNVILTGDEYIASAPIYVFYYQSGSSRYIMSVSSAPFTKISHGKRADGTGSETSTNFPSVGTTYDGKSVNFDTNVIPNTFTPPIAVANATPQVVDLYTILYGDTHVVVDIPVKWRSPYSGDTFEDSFGISVTGSSSGSGSTDGGGYSDDSGGSSSGGGGGF